MYTAFARLYLACLGSGLGVVVFGFLKGLSYEPAYGYGATGPILGWASLLASPFILAAMVLANRSVLARAVRILVALALIAVLFVMLFSTITEGGLLDG